MTDYTELKRLAKAAGSVEWKWWESNSTLRLTTEVSGRHGTDGDAISAYRDSVHCPEPFRAFIESASPAAILALIAEIQRLDENPGMRAIFSLRADCTDLMAERDQLKVENEALLRCLEGLVHVSNATGWEDHTCGEIAKARRLIEAARGKGAVA